MTGRILLLEDMPSVARYYANLLTKAGYDVKTAHTSQEFFVLFTDFDPDLVLLDIQLKGSELNGVEVYSKIKKLPGFHTEVIVMSSQATRTEVAEAMKLGARTFHEKGAENFNRDKFLADVKMAVDVHSQQRRITELRRHLLDSLLVGDSPVMRQVKEKILRFSECDINVLITGETGTGKGVVADLIHRHSDRNEKPFKAVNIQGLPETLIESELFGHRKGAFTSAESAAKGYFERAHGGTLFIDEISSLSMANQVKILTVIEDRKVPVLGAGGEHPSVDVRIISATNRDLTEMIVKDDFRDDLYFRLAVGTIHMPPLRERGEDVLTVLDSFLFHEAQHLGLSLDYQLDAIAEPLLAYNWPGNIRELKNLTQRVAVLHNRINNDAILAEFNAFRQQHGKLYEQRITGRDRLQEMLDIADHRKATDAFERSFIENHLRRANGQVARAAEAVGVDRTTLYKKIKKLGVEATE